MPDKVHIGAGTIVLYKAVGASGTGTELNEVETFGNLSQRRNEVTATPLKSDTVRYIGGLKDGQTMDITCFFLGDDTSQTGLKALYDSNSTVEIIVQPPAGTGSQFRFNYTLLGHDIMHGTGGDPAKRMFTGRLSSDVITEANART
ncbi:hypothetical protein [Methylobacterium aquaticum]|jgi:hypothetical protein|uniref:Phage tail protein n=1 Tax=Methylobacterium aquaticum TaxID=270351 RepID=A0A0J6SGG5_9HYPH|nr:hypothetical protein [Methylobacterium aquaticum]KMO34325.1 hypothetical protein VP06_14770 [Methylobacterium aquaticum]